MRKQQSGVDSTGLDQSFQCFDTNILTWSTCIVAASEFAAKLLTNEIQQFKRVSAALLQDLSPRWWQRVLTHVLHRPVEVTVEMCRW